MHKKSSISILGTGNAGTTLGSALNGLGYTVCYGSRTPLQKTSFKGEVHHLAEAVSKSDILINTIPGEHALGALASIDPALFKNKVLIDLSVALTSNFFLKYPNESGAEKIQDLLAETSVVKTFCTMTSAVMVNPKSLSGGTSIFLSGNDPEAKKAVSEILLELGWDANAQVDLGDIKTARGQEHFGMLYFNLFESFGHDNFNIKVVL